MFHSSRVPQAIKKQLPALTFEEWFEEYQVSMIDVRQIVDWANSRGEINKERIAAVGISFGGFISAITMGVDRHIKAGVFLVAGGNSEEITWRSKMSAIRMGASCTEAECHPIHSCYPQYLAEVAEKGFENITPAKKMFFN